MSLAPASLETLAAYNRWMNERVFAASATLDDAARKLDRGAFFSSLHGTLNHILLADRLWLGRFERKPYGIDSLDDELYADFDELRRERALTDDAIDAWVGGLDADALAADFVFETVVNPARTACPLWHAALHFFNHQTHHRGQVTTLLMQAGVDPGVTDLLRLPGRLRTLAS